jgi:hypothetical protein
MTLPSTPFPAYLTIDPRSPWHVSALFSTALESMTLPSRLRIKNGQRQTLDEIAGALNVNGNQNIAKLQMSIGPDSEPPKTNGELRPGRLEARAQSRDLRMPSQDGRAAVVDPKAATPVELDMNFFPSEEPDRVRGRRVTKKTHIFGQAENIRGNEENAGNGDDDDDFDGQERARRRAAGLPILHKYVTPVLLTRINIPLVFFLATPRDETLPRSL